MHIIIDTREKNLLDFSDYENVVAEIDYLDCGGDYTLREHDRPSDDHSIIIEKKKNSAELLSNIGQNWDVFQQELEKLANYRHKQIVVCAPNEFFELYSKGFTRLHPNFSLKRLAEIYIKYGVSTIFLPSHMSAANYVFRLFLEVQRAVQDE